MSKKSKSKKQVPKGRERQDEEEDEEVPDLLNFPTLSSSKSTTEGKYDTWMILACAAIVASVYISTMFPTVPGGDSPELIIAAYQMGVAHPPGYPLFTIVGHLFTYLPFGSPAWRVNLMSAMCGVLSSVFLYRTVVRWSGSHAAALLSALMFAFSPLVWTYTVQAEVFSMNNLLVNALLYLVISYAYYFSKSDKKFLHMAYLGALVGGFGASNQHTIVFIFIPIVFWIFFVVGRNEFLYVPSRWVTLAMFMLLGLSPYIHMFLSPQLHQEKYSWGDTGSIGGFIHHFLRKEYGTFQLYSGNLADTTGWQERVRIYFTRLAGEVLYVGLPLAVIGLWASLRGKNRVIFSSVGWLLAICFFLYITVFYYLTNLPIQNPLHLGVLLRFFMQPNAIVCAWMGLGYAYVESLWASRGGSRAVPVLLVLLICTSQISLNFSAMDQHDNYIFYKYGKAVLEPLPKNAILLAGGDLQTNIPYYMQLCEGVRPDVDIVSIETMSWDWYVPRQAPLYPNITFPGKVYHPFKRSGFSMKLFLDANIKRPMFLAGEWKVGDNSHEKPYTTAPFGLTQHIYPSTHVFDIKKHVAFAGPALQAVNLSIWQPYSPFGKYGPETWEYVVGQNFWEAYQRHANMYLTAGFKREADSETYLKEAIRLLEYEANNRGMKNKWTYKYLGAAWDHLRLEHPYDTAIIAKIVETWSEFIALGNDPVDPEFDSIVKAVEMFRSGTKK
eukprot:Phypoly_transcript_00702.p1 GENE.Phypoly_transcript_00702~~Phypoly_transcript_00702.p1  ORF type:complete len:724 (+),score=95.06 Phypoly_transcript_00702:2004-4175(+)